MLRNILITVLVLLLVGASMPSSHAQTGERCFAETGFCLSGRFREYWEQNGGLPIFGYPITAAQDEPNRDTGATHLTQYFERARFELHPDLARPYDVLLGRLGDDQLRLQGIDWQAEPEDRPRDDCLWFAETRHSVCDQAPGLGFKSYWQSHGLVFDEDVGFSFAESLALFGLPLTGARVETNSSGDTVLTQWFERARFEWHPDQPARFRVLLGLLGNETSIPLLPARNPRFLDLAGRLLVQADRLYEVAADGSRVTRLAFNPDGGLTLSGDGRQIATRCTLDGGAGLCVLNIDGTGTRRLNDDPNITAARWSPDGSRIAYVSGSDDRRGLHVINVDGSGDLLLMPGTPGLMPSSPSWSPDSTRIVFNTVFSATALYVVDADGRNLRQIAQEGAFAHWSPTGNRIVFEAFLAGNPDIWIIDANGSNLTQLTSSADSETRPQWSPDGTHIAYHWSGHVEPNPAGAPTGVYVMRSDGSGKTRALYTEPVYRYFGFAWSPDSTYVAASRFCSRLCGPAQIVAAPMDGSRQLTLVEHKRPGFSATLLAWLP